MQDPNQVVQWHVELDILSAMHARGYTSPAGLHTKAYYAVREWQDGMAARLGLITENWPNRVTMERFCILMHEGVTLDEILTAYALLTGGSNHANT